MTETIQSKTDFCPACESENLDETIESFGAVCEECGFVNRDGCESPPLDWEITDGMFHQPRKQNWMAECPVRNATEKQIAQAFQKLERFADELDVSEQIRIEAADLYCDAFRAEHTDGRKTACVVAVCLCLASRQIGIPVPMSRLTQFQNVDQTKFNQAHITLCKELQIEVKTPNPREYLQFLDSQLDLTTETKDDVASQLTTIEGKQAFVGKDPAGIAASCLYRSTNEYTQSEVSSAVGLSSETVRQRVNELNEMDRNV